MSGEGLGHPYLETASWLLRSTGKRRHHGGNIRQDPSAYRADLRQAASNTTVRSVAIDTESISSLLIVERSDGLPSCLR